VTLLRLLVSAFLAGLAVFIWAPWPTSSPLEPLTVLKEAAPFDEVYMNPRGVFLAVRFAPTTWPLIRRARHPQLRFRLLNTGHTAVHPEIEALGQPFLLGQFLPQY
jgi:hypothetical protein